MADTIFKIPRVADESLVAAFKAVTDKHGIGPMTAQTSGDVSLGSWNLQPDSINANWKFLLSQKSDIIQSAHAAIGGLSIHFHRGGRQADKNAYFDEITVGYNQPGGVVDEVTRMGVAALLSDALGGVLHSDIKVSGTPQEQVQAIHNSVLSRLETVSTSLIEKSAAYANDLERKLIDDREKNANALATEKERLDTEHQNRLDKLKVREESLEQKLGEIDNRDNTHARREIRNRMLEDVKARIQKFGVSKETTDKRNPVRLGIFVLLLFFAIALVLTASALYQMEWARSYQRSTSVSDVVAPPANSAKDTTGLPKTVEVAGAPDNPIDRYLLWLRLGLLSLGVAGTLLYYIRWENRWAERHANAEFQLQQFYLDVNRANWVIESCLEWRKEANDSAIPGELLTSITRNLFVDKQSEPEQVVHPADELASALLGSSSKLRLRAGNSELEFDKPGKIPKARKVEATTG